VVAAQSQMVIIEKALERAFPEDERARRSIIEAAKERIAHHLEHGHSFARATVLDSVQERHRPGTDKDEARHGGRLRMQEQER
jgi:hypothetical protein